MVETLEVIGNEACRDHFLADVTGRIEKESDDKSALQHLLQLISITVQRGNGISTLETLN